MRDSQGFLIQGNRSGSNDIPLADEPLINDMLAGRLEIAVGDLAEDLWRFTWESKEKVRGSAKP